MLVCCRARRARSTLSYTSCGKQGGGEREGRGEGRGRRRWVDRACVAMIRHQWVVVMWWYLDGCPREWVLWVIHGGGLEQRPSRLTGLRLGRLEDLEHP